MLQAQGLGIIDVGARGGVSPTVQAVAPLCDVVGFEPDADEARRLQEAGRRSVPWRSLAYLPYGLGAADGERLLYLCRSPGASSFYKPNRRFVDRFPDAGRFDIVTTATVPVRSLDSLVKDSQVAMPAFIGFLKIDTQGGELEILHGAEQVLREQAVAVEVEVLFAPIYESPSTFRDVDAFLNRCGFTLFKLRRMEWVRQAAAQRPQISAGQLVFGDALYLRDPLSARNGGAPAQPAQLEALVLIALLYDLHDFALELVHAPAWDGVFDRDVLRDYVGRQGRRLNSLRERCRMAKALCSASSGWRRYASRWARGDDNFYSVSNRTT